MKLVISDLSATDALRLVLNHSIWRSHTRPLWSFDYDDKDVVIWLLVLHCGRDKAACNAV